MKNLLTAALFASVIALPAAASAAELVVNGGFETGDLSGWAHSSNGTLSVLTPTGGHTGVAGGYFIAETNADYDFLAQHLATVSGQTYNYSFWLAGATTDATAPSHFYAGLGGETLVSFYDTGTFDYFNLTGSYTATSSDTVLYFEAFNSLGLYLLDDVSVTARTGVCLERSCGGGGGGVPEPQSWALMLLGFGGIGAMLRRRPRAATA